MRIPDPISIFNALTFGKYEDNPAKKEASVFGGVFIYLILTFIGLAWIAIWVASKFGK